MANMLPVACIAPPLSDELLAKYRNTVSAVKDDALRKPLDMCLACVEAWWALPDSKAAPTATLGVSHNGKALKYDVVPLGAELVAALDAHTPYMDEMYDLSPSRAGDPNMGKGLFDLIEDKDLRTAAFHLLWFAKEITSDREPITMDKAR